MRARPPILPVSPERDAAPPRNKPAGHWEERCKTHKVGGQFEAILQTKLVVYDLDLPIFGCKCGHVTQIERGEMNGSEKPPSVIDEGLAALPTLQ